MSNTPRAMARSSSASVSTRSPLWPTTTAVPVSWHPGRTPPAAMLALRSSSVATNRSLADASGSSKMEASWAKCPVRSRWAMSRMASLVSSRRASGSTWRNWRSPSVTVET